MHKNVFPLFSSSYNSEELMHFGCIRDTLVLTNSVKEQYAYCILNFILRFEMSY